MALLEGSSKPLKPSIVAFLRAQQCGFDNGFPRVCCRTMPKELRVMTYTTTTRKIGTSSATTTTSPTVTAEKPSSSQKNLKVLSNEFHQVIMDDFFDYDLFRRRRGAKSSKSNVDIEIR